MPAFVAGLAKVGAVIGKAVAGTAKGLAAGAKVGAKATAKGAKSSGKLVKSSTKVRNNIVKSNKRIGKIKKNRQRIRKSIKNEQQRLQKERSLERKRTSNKIPGSGILNNPVISGLKKFIYTLLFGLAITNIEKIMKSLEKVKEMIAGFVKFIVDIKTGVDNVISAFKGDEARMEKEKENFDSALGKMNDALDNVDTDGLLKKSKEANKKVNSKLVNQGVGQINKSGTDIVTEMEGGKRWQDMNLEELLLAIEKSKSEGGNKSQRKMMQRRVIILKWAKENNVDVNNLNIDQLKKDFNMENINLSKIQKKDNLTALNSSTDQDTVVITKTIIKKEYVPVG